MAERTPGGHRRYDLSVVQALAKQDSLPPHPRSTLAYARVSSHDQKADLVRQAALLADYCAVHGWQHQVIQDLGSGLNYDKKGLKALIRRICHGEVERLVVTHKDRLLRFGAELIFALCEQFAVEVVIVNRSPEESSAESELVQDVLEIITVFSARLYGSRSHKTKHSSLIFKKRLTKRVPMIKMGLDR